MEDGNQTFLQWLRHIVETYSPLDFILIAENFDRFLYGVLVTLELTFLALILGGLMAIPMAIARASKHKIFNAPVWCYTYVFPRHAASGPDLSDLLRPRPVRMGCARAFCGDRS